MTACDADGRDTAAAAAEMLVVLVLVPG